MHCVLLILFTLICADLTPWTEGGMTSGKYRNLFAELGYSQAEIDSKLKGIFQEVFEDSTSKVYFEVNTNQAYVSDLKNHDVRTEGMSYGLMIAVQFDRQDIFDRIWRWASTYMQHKSGAREGYFAWSLNTNGQQNSEGSASDGELYFVTALIFASNRWGNTGSINYLKEAQYILTNQWSKNGTSGVMPFVNKNQHLINFTPDTGGDAYTDPSYHLPVFYEIYAKWGGDGHADFWTECASKARQYLHAATHATTGLCPDHTNYDGSNRDNRAFRFDSWRVPMNIALDFSWSNADASWQTQYGERIQNFLYSKGVKTFVDQYNPDGSNVSSIASAGGKTALRHSLGLVATAAAVSLTVRHDKAKEFVEELWNAKNVAYSDGYIDYYYDGLLRLFAFMHLSGNYKVITPK